MKYLKHIQALQRDFSVWNTLPEQIKYEPNVFLRAFMVDNKIFKDAPSKIKENDDLVKSILKLNGYSIEHCIQRHQHDKTMVELALLSTPMVAKIVDPIFLNDEELLLRLANKSGHVFAVRKESFDPKWFSHQEIMHAAISTSPLVFQLASEKYRSSYKNCLHACEMFAGNYRFVDLKVREKHQDLAILVLQENPSMLKHVPEDIKNQPDFILKSQFMERE